MNVFDALLIPDLVVQELRVLQLDPARLNIAASVVNIADAEWRSVIASIGKNVLHPADAQVFALARAHQFREPVLTDDLALRRQLENVGTTVVGTIGILVRAYSSGRLNRSELDGAVDLLFTMSTLHLSRAFKVYIQHLLKTLP